MPPEVPVKLSISIVSYNTRDLLARCLESIRATAGDLAVETIVVDNGSGDGSAEMVRARFPETRLIEPGRNTWFTGGNNLAFRAAQGEYVLILNPDTELHPGMVATLVGGLDAHPTWGAVTAQQLYADGVTQRNCSRFPSYLDLWLGYTALGTLAPGLRARRRAATWYADWDRRSDRAVEVAPDSCLMVRRALLEGVGLYDERMKLYFTEDDLCQRIQRAGYEIHYLAEAVITHQESASTRQVQRTATQAYFDDLAVFARKYYGPFRGALLMAFATPTRLAMNLAQRHRGEGAIR
jgi:N-acetylglucosaminyl-diphospho-decaprenol L-rhamnosyltransferase